MTSIGAAVTSDGTEVAGVTEIEVLESLGEPSRFRFRVGLSIADGDLPGLAESSFDPGATIDVAAAGQLLVRGPVTGQRAHLAGEGDTSWLDVVGGDRLLELAREERLSAWSMMRVSDVVTSIVGGYQLVPDVEATGTRYGPTTHDLIQRGSDLDFIRRLARSHGYLFWLSINPLGLETAHFKRPPVDGAPDTTLDLHLPGAALDELDLEWDAARPTSVTAAGLDSGDLSTIDASVDASPLPAMASSNLAAVAAGTRPALVAAPGDDLAALSAPGEALLTEAELFVTARATTTVARAGAILHAHTLVNVDGIGRRHSGAWLVSSVRHLIDAVAHRMECTFVRNGWEG